MRYLLISEFFRQRYRNVLKHLNLYINPAKLQKQNMCEIQLPRKWHFINVVAMCPCVAQMFKRTKAHLAVVQLAVVVSLRRNMATLHSPSEVRRCFSS